MVLRGVCLPRALLAATAGRLTGVGGGGYRQRRLLLCSALNRSSTTGAGLREWRPVLQRAYSTQPESKEHSIIKARGRRCCIFGQS
ncbi:hypothetical protein MRX96_003602 [Rhipicephalus microplus]